MSKSAKQIRSEFLSFFESKAHRIVDSAPVVPQGDPTLLFINAGMNQFKDVFLGTGKRDYVRAADSQKCIRVSGKHNDLEEVGVDTYHHTFFEMLGNWSFGDYFKEEAIVWAWELLTEVWKLPKERLWVSVFAGDEKDGLPADEEAERLWIEKAGVAPERVLRFDRTDNFWEMGETGPCGPCTEIHFDRGDTDANPADGADLAIGVNAGNERFIEIWNLVFIEFNRRDDGSLENLPARHVDTGMGFERITSIMQGKSSNYDTDLFTPIFRRIEEVTGKTYGEDETADIAFRVIADHLRALSIAFSDGALPGNEGRGYVLRRILRRAARFGRQSLEQEAPFIHKLVPAVVDTLGEAFPAVAQRQDHITLLIDSEEKAFAQTLDRGLDLYTRLASKVKKSGRNQIAGGEAFDLYATFGFPRDLVELMAREDELTVDSTGWDEAEAAHRSASKGAGAFAHAVSQQELEGLPATDVVCYRGTDGTHDGTVATAKPIKLIDDRALILDCTPFYAESGGQVGDAGLVEADGFRFVVEDTQKFGDVVAHLGKLETGDANTLPGEVTAQVDVVRRQDTMRNHTATHLMHWALHEVLGDHATQQGSLVAPDRLRFDVAHPKAISADEIETIERLVNGRIIDNDGLGTTVEDLDAARARGVTALFGEKYDDEVRVVDIGGYSTELCGGTHCGATGDIGSFVITNESALQAGVRRIEAVTGRGALAHFQSERRLLREAATMVKAKPTDMPSRIEALQKQVKDLKKKGGKQAASDAAGLARDAMAKAETVGEVKVVVTEVKISPGELSNVADVLKGLAPTACGLIAAREDGRVALVAFATKDLAGKKVHAGNLIRETAKMVGGGGGGRPDFAQAGGKDASQLDAALAHAKLKIGEMLVG